ncbi:hypothetical protein EYF80_023293 [Liparis tanakae]|uniref:Uncharacterized protein n=1 Tax=Liparis tanakae TaxID=230148 RepID=A0A4Z2HLR0_9TELE|nr:hypothetical protein EYF80_023293 [Liparis tanakae]
MERPPWGHTEDHIVLQSPRWLSSPWPVQPDNHTHVIGVAATASLGRGGQRRVSSPGAESESGGLGGGSNTGDSLRRRSACKWLMLYVGGEGGHAKLDVEVQEEVVVGGGGVRDMGLSSRGDSSPWWVEKPEKLRLW